MRSALRSATPPMAGSGAARAAKRSFSQARAGRSHHHGPQIEGEMIGLLNGVAAAVGEDAALIDVNGVGYVVQAGGHAQALGGWFAGAAAHRNLCARRRHPLVRLFPAKKNARGSRICKPFPALAQKWRSPFSTC